jgi:hypothetical protein
MVRIVEVDSESPPPTRLGPCHGDRDPTSVRAKGQAVCADRRGPQLSERMEGYSCESPVTLPATQNVVLQILRHKLVFGFLGRH